MTTIASLYDRGMFNVATGYVLRKKLLHFLSRGHTRLRVRKSDIDLWRLAQAQWMALGGGGARGYQTR